jgi:hypothetical protein
MFKLFFLLFLGWLAFRMLRAGKVVMGIVRGVEQVMRDAGGTSVPQPEEPEGRVTVRRHRQSSPGGPHRELEAEDVPFEDV